MLDKNLYTYVDISTYPYIKVTGCQYVYLSVAKDLAICWTNMVLHFSEIFQQSKECFKNILEEGTSTLPREFVRKKRTSLNCFYLRSEGLTASYPIFS